MQRFLSVSSLPLFSITWHLSYVCWSNYTYNKIHEMAFRLHDEGEAICRHQGGKVVLCGIPKPVYAWLPYQRQARTRPQGVVGRSLVPFCASVRSNLYPNYLVEENKCSRKALPVPIAQ
jgi:hypothetical protein